MKPRVVKVHFNRLGCKRGDPEVWTVQTGGRCLHAHKVIVGVPLETIYRGDTAPQPRAYLRGMGVVRVHKDGSIGIGSE